MNKVALINIEKPWTNGFTGKGIGIVLIGKKEDNEAAKTVFLGPDYIRHPEKFKDRIISSDNYIKEDMYMETKSMEFFLKTLEWRSRRKQKTILEDLPLIHGGVIKAKEVKKASDLMVGIEEAIIRGYKTLIVPPECKKDLTIASSPINPTKEPPLVHNHIAMALLIARAHGIDIVLDEKINWLPSWP